MTGWEDVTQRQRKLLLVGGAVDGVLRLVALIDVIRRPKGEVRGPKALWIAGLTVINSLGVLPTSYFIAGRRKTAD